jgi:fructosamine-3-kinase
MPELGKRRPVNRAFPQCGGRRTFSGPSPTGAPSHGPAIHGPAAMNNRLILMSRTGVETKLPWRQVPKVVRQQVEAALGSPVRRAARIWGGYSPTPTFRLALADGRRAFFKGTHHESTEFARNALSGELRVYEELEPLIGRWMPHYFAAFRQADWQVLLLEDLGPKSVPPWTPSKARGISQALAAFHQSTLGASLPAWLSRPAEWRHRESWAHTVQASQGLQEIAALAGDAAAEAMEWLQTLSPWIGEWMQQEGLAAEPYALLHGDLRSDNLRFARGRLALFDWPAITLGRPEWDLVAFAQTVTVEGGPAPEQVMTWYAEQFPLDEAAVDAALAWWLTFFAERAWQPEIPGLPRLRRFQRQQLGVLLLWAGRRWRLAEPQWAAALLK